MKIITLKLKKAPYNIIVGNGIVSNLANFVHGLRLGSDAYVITNGRIKNRYGGLLNAALRRGGLSAKFRLVPDSEKSKSIEAASRLIKDLAEYDKGRRIFIIAFGGGVIGDLSGFVASIYKRGIPYIQVPTTLLAQVDSSIGGKTAVDLPAAKNLVGAFYQPRLVLSEIGFLKSLSNRQVRAGMAEVIKYGIIKDSHLFTYLEKRYADILSLRPSCLEFVVGRCSNIKARIVERDEREERGLRTILNFGHTVGHAIEAAAGYKRYNHGEAIALGMLVASDISVAVGLLGKSVSLRVENLIRAVGLPTRINRVSLAGIINAHYRDKKFIGKKNRFVLVKDLGITKIEEDIPLAVIKQAVEKRI